VRLAAVAVKGIWRNKFRTTATIAAVAIAIVAFVTLRTVLTAWTAAVDASAKDRIGTRHKVTFIMPLPYRYVQDVRETPGVKAATWATWFGGRDLSHEREFFATIAVDPETFLSVYDEIVVDAETRDRWLANRQGALVGDVLARKLRWRVGDRVTLTGTIYPGPWQFTIDGIYTASRRSVDRSTFWFHWAYLNDRLPPHQQDQVGWIVSRIDDPGQSGTVAKAIDARFAERDVQTVSMSERALNTSFLGMISAVLKAVNVVSVVILLIMALILGNTVAMGVRERTNEYGVLRAIGFLPRHLAALVLGEALTVGSLGGALGLLVAYPVVDGALGGFLEQEMGGLFPYFRIAPSTALVALGLATALGAAAAILPAYRASRLDVVDALRRVG
jgi:putative ABC transport system permease protein